MDNLSENVNINFLSSKTPEGLVEQLQSIKLPYAIRSLYFANGRHYAWIIPSLPIKKVKRTVKQRGK